MNRVAGKIEMIALSATKVVAGLRCQEAQKGERSIFTQPFRDGALRVALFVACLAKGIAIRCDSLRDTHPAKPTVAVTRDLPGGSSWI